MLSLLAAVNAAPAMPELESSLPPIKPIVMHEKYTGQFNELYEKMQGGEITLHHAGVMGLKNLQVELAEESDSSMKTKAAFDNIHSVIEEARKNSPSWTTNLVAALDDKHSTKSHHLMMDTIHAHSDVLMADMNKIVDASNQVLYEAGAKVSDHRVALIAALWGLEHAVIPQNRSFVKDQFHPHKMAVRDTSKETVTALLELRNAARDSTRAIDQKLEGAEMRSQELIQQLDETEDPTKHAALYQELKDHWTTVGKEVTLMQAGFFDWAADAAGKAVDKVKSVVNAGVSAAGAFIGKAAEAAAKGLCFGNKACLNGVDQLASFIKCLLAVPGGKDPVSWAIEAFSDMQKKGFLQYVKDEIKEFFDPMISALTDAYETIKSQFSLSFDIKQEEMDVGQYIDVVKNGAEYVSKIDVNQVPVLAANQAEGFMNRIDAITEDSSSGNSYSKCMYDYILRPIIAAITHGIMWIVRKAIEGMIAAFEAFLELPAVKAFYSSVIKAAQPMIDAVLKINEMRKKFDRDASVAVGKVCGDAIKGLTYIGDNTPSTMWCTNDQGVLDLSVAIKELIPFLLQHIYDKMENMFWAPLGAKIATLIDGALGSLLNLIVGIAGLIPEVGGILFDIIVVPAHQALSVLVPNGANAAINLIRNKIETFITGKALELADFLASKVKAGQDMLVDKVSSAMAYVDNKIPKPSDQVQTVLMDWIIPIAGELVMLAFPKLTTEVLDCSTTLTRIHKKYVAVSCPSAVKSSATLLLDVDHLTNSSSAASLASAGSAMHMAITDAAKSL